MDNAQLMNSLLAKLDRLESQSGDATEQQKDNLPSTFPRDNMTKRTLSVNITKFK